MILDGEEDDDFWKGYIVGESSWDDIVVFFLLSSFIMFEVVYECEGYIKFISEVWYVIWCLYDYVV